MAIGSWGMDIEHLNAGEAIGHETRDESRHQGLALCPQSDGQTRGHRGDQDVRVDAAFELVVGEA